MDMFGLDIECKRKGGNKYYILNEKELQRETVKNWMFSSLSLNVVLDDNRRLFNRILIEKVPSADKYLKQILQAMHGNNIMEMSYKRYDADMAKAYRCCPYCLKLHNRRWYVAMAVLREDTETRIQIFCLDRIVSLVTQPDSFLLPADFDAAEFFSECYGVVVGDDTPATAIRLRAFGRERFAMQDLPVHHSQQLIAQGPDYCDFEICLKPTADFKAFLASKGQWLVVLSPQSIAEEVMDIHREALTKYESLQSSSLGAP
jgi:predicted DNA-binding transcriptional regulator YafY